MSWSDFAVGIGWAVGGFIFASLMEYWGHRLMHQIRWLGTTHREHHARGTGQGVLLEFFDYFKGTWWMMLPPFLLSISAGVGWVVGANLFILFSAFSHQLQHENPKKCFWMRMPVHYVHHAHNQWHHNFGMALDFWDRVFGTYKPLDWQDRLEPEQVAATRRIWQINWLWGGNADADRRMEEERRRKAERAQVAGVQGSEFGVQQEQTEAQKVAEV
jgi:sterol desaturase/sphingolipid hydroxylase (fatty acid hydroxylase superfamily)